MISRFRVELPDGGSAPAVSLTDTKEVSAALDALELYSPRPTVVVVGGAAGLDEAGMRDLAPVFEVGIAPVVQRSGAVGIDGGTHFGVMRLLGEARKSTRATYPLLGVVAVGSVKLRRAQPFSRVDTALEPNHTEFVFVPGEQWGAEAAWIARTATALAGTARSITVLVNGGEIAYGDVEQSVKAGRCVLVVSGSGGTADVFARALTGAPVDKRAVALIESGLVRSAPMDDPETIAELLTVAVGESTTT